MQVKYKNYISFLALSWDFSFSTITVNHQYRKVSRWVNTNPRIKNGFKLDVKLLFFIARLSWTELRFTKLCYHSFFFSQSLWYKKYWRSKIQNHPRTRLFNFDWTCWPVCLGELFNWKNYSKKLTYVSEFGYQSRSNQVSQFILITNGISFLKGKNVQKCWIMSNKGQFWS